MGAKAFEVRVVAACMPKAEGEIAHIAKTATGFDCSLTAGGPAQLRAVKHRKEFSL